MITMGYYGGQVLKILGMVCVFAIMLGCLVMMLVGLCRAVWCARLSPPCYAFLNASTARYPLPELCGGASTSITAAF